VLSPDLQLGLTGYAVYALERMPRPSARELLAAVVRRLEVMAEDEGRGLTWRTPMAYIARPDAAERPEGVAHWTVFGGAAGVVAVLAAACAWGVEPARAGRLLAGGLDWLWAQRGRGGLFPAHPAHQLAWSHGSLGVATTLLVAARLVGDPAWIRRATALALSLAQRHDRAATLRESNLGTGVAGAAHMLARLHAMTGDERFADAARLRLKALLRRRRPDVGLAGYRSYSPVWQRRYLKNPDYPAGWIGLPGLYNGVAGIGLVLLSAVAPVEPAWDRAFLLSQRAPG
jgi:hypothetical protein